MALSRLLLLCMVASVMWDAETKPIDFVCNRAARRAMNVVADMQSALKDCDGSMTLSTAVQLPCTELHIASWENKSHQERRGDIGASLRLLIKGVKVVKALGQAECVTLLLQKLEHNINNYLLILTHLQLSDKKKIGVHIFQMRQLFSEVTQVQDGCPLICVLHNILRLWMLICGFCWQELLFLRNGLNFQSVICFKQPFHCCISCMDQQGPVESTELSCVPGSTQSFSTVLLYYNRLISGKLERFMINLEDRCMPQ